MLVAVDYEFDILLAFSFGESPSEGLESGTDLDFLIKVEQELFYFVEV